MDRKKKNEFGEKFSKKKRFVFQYMYIFLLYVLGVSSIPITIIW